MELQKIYKDLKQSFENADIKNATYEARYLLKNILPVDDSDFIIGKDLDIDNKTLTKIEEYKKRRLSGEPITKILGKNEFWGLEFKVTKDTLDPRPDTEIIIESVLSWLGDRKNKTLKILDIGTGTGCIAISLLHELPNATAIATDISKKALNVAAYNMKYHQKNNRMKLVNCNYADSISGRFDIIVSNPPYISSKTIKTLAKEVQNHDPILALDGGKDGLNAYKNIFYTLPNLLKKDGAAFFEIGFNQENDLLRLGRESKVNRNIVHRDYAGNARVVEISYGDK